MLSARVLIVAGCVAAAGAVLFGAAGIVIFGGEMLPNLFAEFAGVLLEVAIVILVIERLATRQRRRDARFAYDAVADRAAITFVDVMRLIWVRASAAAMSFNGERYDEFRQIADLHLAEFRSNIVGFAGSLDAASHESLRKIDRRLTWAIARLGAAHLSPAEIRDLQELAAETAEFIGAFLTRNGGAAFLLAEQSALLAFENTPPEPGRDSQSSVDRSFHRRLRAQTEYLRRWGRSRPLPRGILYDPDNVLAFGYFVIDRAILASAS
jgi:hypothetical protein